jgi:hypothetical protein
VNYTPPADWGTFDNEAAQGQWLESIAEHRDLGVLDVGVAAQLLLRSSQPSEYQPVDLVELDVLDDERVAVRRSLLLLEHLGFTRDGRPVL